MPGDNGRIAFQADTGTGNQIYTVRPNGNDLRQITHVSVAAVAPEWSPDGRLIAFEHDSAVCARVAIMNADGDWQLNGIASFLGGMPLDVRSGANTAGLADSGNLAQRPDLVIGVPIYLHNPGDPLQYLNPAAFSLPGIGQFGSLGRGVIRGPGIRNFDLSIVKNWRVRDRYNLQFRVETFNAFNRANFSEVDSGLSFGQIEKLRNGEPNPNFGKPLNPNFGRITATRGPREIQFALKFSF